MKASQRHSIVVERRVIRGDGVPRPGDHNQVVAVYTDDGDVERALGAGVGVLADRTGVTPLAPDVRAAQVSDEYLERMERMRWEQERERNR